MAAVVPSPAAAAPATFVPARSASLYVGDLAPDVSEALLFEIFNAVGPVASVRVCRDAHTRRSLGYAYVNFHRVEDAERALDTLNFKNIKNKPCRIMWCNRDPSLRKSGSGNVFVNGLDKTIDNKQLYDTFSIFGNILSCKVATSSKGESLGYGFVHFETEEAALASIEKANGKMISGTTVSVCAFKSKKDRTGAKDTFTNVFAKNLPGELNKEQLDALFSKFGTITSSVLSVNPANPTLAFAFINFSTAEEAQAAVAGLHDSDCQGRKLYVSRAMRKDEREKEIRSRIEQLKAQRQQKYAGVNLYVKNLSDSVTDAELLSLFTKFGNITSAKIMKDTKGVSRGFGFVCFSTTEEASKAVTEMNQKMFNNKPLYVALAQRKDQRRAILEQQMHMRMPMVPFGQAPAGPMMFPQQRMLPFPQGPQAPMGMPRPAGPMGMPVNRAVNYHLVPLPVQHPLHPQQHNRGRQPRPNQRSVNQNGRQGAEQGIKYQAGVRNVPVNGPVAEPAQPVQAVAEVPVNPNEPLTIKALAAAPVEKQKHILGERLFPLISALQPALAGKITGMLLEMDNGELLHLLESPQALQEKVSEAMEVLRASDFPMEQ